MPTTTYLNFDILFHAHGDGYTARTLGSQAGDKSVHFELPFSATELAGWTAGAGVALRHLRPANQEGKPPSLDARRFGEQLYAVVFGGEMQEALILCRNQARAQDMGLRLRLRFDDDAAELAALPWEYLYSTTWDRFVALSAGTPVVRYIQSSEPPQPLEVTPPVRVLALIADPVDVLPLNVAREWQLLQDALAGLQRAHDIVLERLPAATYAALQNRLEGDPVHVLHFVGHGYFDDPDGETPRGGLVFEDRERRAHCVDATQLATLLHDHASLRLVFLNACDGARSKAGNFFAGVAQRLVQQRTPAVVAMQFPVSDKAALALAQHFYSALVTGVPIDAALTAARKAVFGLPAQPHAPPNEWATPVFFSRAPDNQLFRLPQGDARPAIARQPFEPETVLIPGGPFWMGSDDGPASEAPRHEVDLPAFRIGIYPVTNAEYALYVRAEGVAVRPELGWTLATIGQAPPAGRELHPVVGLNWDEARAYCAWLSKRTGRGYRLPTEAEWEKAARGPDGRSYPWGDEWVEERCNVAGKGTLPVDSFPDGASPYGCHDMLGNVMEWTQTCWGRSAELAFPYPYRPDDGREALDPPAGPYRESRICRGGAYRSRMQPTVHARFRAEAGGRDIARGFRVAMALHDRSEPNVSKS